MNRVSKAFGGGGGAAASAAARVDVGDFAKIIKSGDAAEVSVFIKNMDDSQLKVLAKNLDGMSAEDLAKIGKKMDNQSFEKIAKADPELAKKLRGADPDATKVSPTPDASKAAKLKTVGGKLFTQSTDFLKSLGVGSVNQLKKFFGSTTTTWTKSADEGMVSFKTVNKNGDVIEKGTKKATPEQLNALKNMDEIVTNNRAAREGLIKTGMYVTGGVVFLMMLYDTLNPFEAIHKAVKETGQVVRGLKEVADEAAEAAKDVATSGFDFISFVSNNSWISFACSILCAILLFALFMMGFLGSMGGGNNKGR